MSRDFYGFVRGAVPATSPDARATRTSIMDKYAEDADTEAGPRAIDGRPSRFGRHYLELARAAGLDPEALARQLDRTGEGGTMKPRTKRLRDAGYTVKAAAEKLSASSWTITQCLNGHARQGALQVAIAKLAGADPAEFWGELWRGPSAEASTTKDTKDTKDRKPEAASEGAPPSRKASAAEPEGGARTDDDASARISEAIARHVDVRVEQLFNDALHRVGDALAEALLPGKRGGR